MRAIFLSVLLLGSSLPLGAESACPKNKKEWQALGPKLFLEKAAFHSTPAVEITDFSARIGKKGGATGTATPFKIKNIEYAMVQAKSEELFLSGVLRCDPGTHEPVLQSLSWVKGDKSGLIAVSKP